MTLTAHDTDLIVIVLRGIVVLLSLLRIHQTQIYNSVAILYIMIILGYGTVLVGDIDRYFNDSYFLVGIAQYGSLIRFIWLYTCLIFGLGYMCVRGDTRTSNKIVTDRILQKVTDDAS